MSGTYIQPPIETVRWLTLSLFCCCFSFSRFLSDLLSESYHLPVAALLFSSPRAYRHTHLEQIFGCLKTALRQPSHKYTHTFDEEWWCDLISNQCRKKSIVFYLVMAFSLRGPGHETQFKTQTIPRPRFESVYFPVSLTPGCALNMVIESAGYPLAIVDYLFLPPRLTAS